MNKNYKQIVKRAIDNESFIKIIFSRPHQKASMTWVKVVIRPVLIKDKKHTQFSYFTKTQDITKNYQGEETQKKLDELLNLPFQSIYIQTINKNIQIEIERNRKAKVHEHEVSKEPISISVIHDNQKRLIIPAEIPNKYLEAVGIMTKEGKVKSDMYDKFRQINEFLRFASQVSSFRHSELFSESSSISVVDFGCGNGYLTFALAYYFREVLRKDTHIIGVDLREDLIKNLQIKAKQIQADELSFQKSRIADFTTHKNPDMVVALHACDTATDETLAKAIQWESKVIFVAPCCHHNLQTQMSGEKNPSLFTPITKHDILKERLADLLTDAFRLLILQIMGYQVSIVEFISSEHTSKNLLIRAVRTDIIHTAKYKDAYIALKKYWKVIPYLEKLIYNELQTRL